MRRLHAYALLFAGSVASAACTLIVDTAGLARNLPESADAQTDALLEAAGVDGGGGDATADAGGDAASPADATGDSPPNGCGGDAGPPMVSVGSYCIDATLVTNAQYAQFVAARGTNTAGQPSACSFNTSFALKCAESGTANDDPVTCVNWCDAYAYCAWAGKRLCGAIGGGAGTAANLTNAAKDQWYQACSHGGAQGYPYGTVYQPGLCNDIAHGVGKPVVAGSLTGCVGGYPGLFDMLGNAVEWVDVCTASAGATDPCFIRGSAFDDGDVQCSGSNTQDRNSTDNTKGFRCCSVP